MKRSVLCFAANLCLAVVSSAQNASLEGAAGRAQEILNQTGRPRRPTWAITRDSRATKVKAITGPGATVASAASETGLSAAVSHQWHAWLSPAEGHTYFSDSIPILLANGSRKEYYAKENYLDENDELAPGLTFWVPNTIVALWYGDLGQVGKTIVGWQKDLDYLAGKGFKIEKIEHANEDVLMRRLRELVGAGALHGLVVMGHGSKPNTYSGTVCDSQGNEFYSGALNSLFTVNYGLALVIVNTCYGNELGKSWVSDNGLLMGANGILVPPFEVQSPRRRKL
jgi:hypothetical protein